MALATRCPNCQAMFRVVSDQLKLRGGLVRCGSCRHVFDAISSLSYIEDAALTAAAPPPPAAAASNSPAASTSASAPAGETGPPVAARANSLANGVPADAAQYTPPDRLLPTDTADGTFDVVLANILANPLKLLAPALLARVAPGGALVLAGILERQTDEMIDLYCRLDPTLPLTAWRCEDGWVCLAGKRMR